MTSGTPRVFLSSTYSDLATHRSHVMDVLARFGAVCKGMEFFGASQYTALEECFRQLDLSDQVIAIIGTSYGSVAPKSSQSYTELELERAYSKGLPIHVYFLDEERHPVLAKDVSVGEAAQRLSDLKKKLASRHTIVSFNSPADLAVKIACDLQKPGTYRAAAMAADTIRRGYRECAYDLLAEWYDHWYEGHYRSTEPFDTIKRIAGGYFESDRGNIENRAILDCACGTGNTFVAFKRAGYNIYGTDGSQEMLLRAEQNCRAESVTSDTLIQTPINWTDIDGYYQHFATSSFDLIVNTSNSFCHIPPTPEYMAIALKNFAELLKPGGLLIIDTKRYMRSDPVNGVPTHKELRYDAHSGEWLERYERQEVRNLPGLGKVNFHTRLMYDTDPSFSVEVRRALILVTIYGENVAPKTLVVPYYPLPAQLLQELMSHVGLRARTIQALTREASNWKYDIVVGQKA